MGSTTPSMAKNQMARAIRNTVYGVLTKKDKKGIRDFFDHECVYCGKKLGDDKRAIAYDHLIPTAAGGDNGKHNMVLSCSPCNDERRDQEWESFLVEKRKQSEDAQRIAELIIRWHRQSEPKHILSDKVEGLVQEAREYFDSLITRAGALRDSPDSSKDRSDAH